MFGTSDEQLISEYTLFRKASRQRYNEVRGLVSVNEGVSRGKLQCTRSPTLPGGSDGDRQGSLLLHRQCLYWQQRGGSSPPHV